MFLLKTHPVVRGIKIGSNQPPQWISVPSPTFTLGTASNFPPSGTYQSNGYVTDANGDTITLTWISGSITGVTWDGGRFVYNGAGSAGTTGSLVLRANDGTDTVDSSAFSIVIESNLAWSATPSVSFVEASLAPVNLGSYVTNYNASTDEFRVTPTYSLPLWLSLTAGPGSGAGNLTPNGNQVDADDVSASPGIKIDVRRSGGAWVTSNAFGVTVTAAPAATGTIEDLAFEGRFTISWTDPQMAVTGQFWTGKHTAWRYNSSDQKVYGFGGDGIYPGSNIPVQDGNIHYPRFTLDANKQPIFDIYYPWMGKAGKEFPICADDHSFIWDSLRQIFWCIGGYSGGPLLSTTYPGRTVVGAPVRAQERLWKFHPATGTDGEWESLGALATLWPNVANLYGQRGSYASVHDCLVYVAVDGGGFARVRWYNCATGDNGFKSTSFQIGANVPTDNPTIYDPVNDELIFLCYASSPIGAHAIKLTNLFTAGALTVRTLVSAGNFLTGQTPMWIRNRRLYIVVQPFYSSEWGTLIGGYGTWSSQGSGLGVYEATLDTPTVVVSKCGVPQARNYVNTGGAINRAANEGDYSSADDAVVLTSINATDAVQVYRYSPPSWTPAQGDVKALTTDWTGSSSFSSFFSIYEGNSTQMGNVPTAWMSGAYCRDMGMNGAYLCQGGGDQDSFDNSVRAFCFDSRRWYRLSNRATNFTGGDAGSRAVDYARDPSDPFYFNAALCEHGPAVADSALVQGGTNWGLFPINATTGAQATQPGVPHMYDGAVWVPGGWIGNQRGAFVRPESKFVYGGSAQTRRAHYFDLDKLKWGRLSVPPVVGNDSYLPVSAIDETNGTVFYTYGYLNLTTKAQTSKSWFGGQDPGDHAIEFDPVRRLLIYPGGSGSGALSVTPVTNIDSPGAKQQISTVAGNAGGLWTATNQWSGIAYCSWLDCFFYYNSRAEGGQFIWKIQPPSTNQAAALAGQWTCTKITMGGDTVSAGTQLTYGNLFAIPKLKCMGICIPSGSMYIFKP